MNAERPEQRIELAFGPQHYRRVREKRSRIDGIFFP
jgi:hypothetical protein